MKDTDGYLIAAIVGLSGVVVFLFKILMDKMKEDKIQSEIIIKEITKNTLAMENNNRITENNTKLYDKVIEMINKSLKR